MQPSPIAETRRPADPSCRVITGGPLPLYLEFPAKPTNGSQPPPLVPGHDRPVAANGRQRVGRPLDLDQPLPRFHRPVSAHVSPGARKVEHGTSIRVLGHGMVYPKLPRWLALLRVLRRTPGRIRRAATAAGKTRTSSARGRVRIAAEPLEEYLAGYVIEMWKSPPALNIAQSDDDRIERISKITSEMAQLQEQKNEALRMKLRGEVDLQTYRAVAREVDAAHDQLAREHKSLTSEAAMPELPDPSLAWEDLSAGDRRALTEMLVDKIIIERHPSKIDKDSRRHYLIRAIPYQDPQQEAERLKAVHEARVKIVPRA